MLSKCQARRLGGSVGSDEPPLPPPPTEAIEFHLAWLKQGNKVCKDNKPYAAIHVSSETCELYAVQEA